MFLCISVNCLTLILFSLLVFTFSFIKFHCPSPTSSIRQTVQCTSIYICTRILAIPLSHLLYKSRLSLYRTCYQTVPCTTYLYQPPLIFLLFLCPIAYPPATFGILYIYYHSDPPPTCKISPISNILTHTITLTHHLPARSHLSPIYLLILSL